MNDPIVEEVRKARDEYAAQFNYDLKAMVRDLREQQKRSGRKFINYGPRKEELFSSSEAAKEPSSQAAVGNIALPQPAAATK